jgi:hypothetical protein
MTQPDLLAALAAGLDDPLDSWGAESLHASDLSVALPGADGKCPRQLWLRTHSALRAAPTLGKALMFDHGKGIHSRIVPMLERGLKGTGWRLAHVELSLKGLLPDIDSGRLDTVLYGPDGQVLVLDFKTVRGAAFRYLTDPKPKDILQVQTYALAFDADGGVLLYIDREGQNGAKQFDVVRDDEAVERATLVAREIVGRESPPDLLRPTLEIRANKGPDAVYLNEPWQCRYCDYRDVACDGALPKALRDLGIVAKLKDDGTLKPQTNNEAAFQMVTQLHKARTP